MRRVALLITALMLAGGCTTVTPGTPSAAPPPTLGSRPRELRLNGIDPCSLLTPAQRTMLGLEQQQRSYTTGPPAPGPACSIIGFTPRDIAVDIALGLMTDITDITRPGAVSDDLTPMTIVGFPAVLARPRNPDGCIVDVDVAHGQILDLLFADGGGSPTIPQPDLCRGAVSLAEEVVTTLAAR